MKTRISSKGQIVIPASIRQLDGIEAGEQFEITRVGKGHYQLRRQSKARSKGLVELLLACPVKGFFRPAYRAETTNDVIKRNRR